MKFYAILLSNMILLQSLNINFETFSKLNVLLEHAQFHQEKYGDSFIEFLYKHYGDQKISENLNHKEHKDLPFKNNSNHFNHLVSILEINVEKFNLKKQKTLLSKSNFFYKESYTNFEKPSIFQPPKFA